MYFVHSLSGESRLRPTHLSLEGIHDEVFDLRVLRQQVTERPLVSFTGCLPDFTHKSPPVRWGRNALPRPPGFRTDRAFEGMIGVARHGVVLLLQEYRISAYCQHKNR